MLVQNIKILIIILLLSFVFVGGFAGDIFAQESIDLSKGLPHSLTSVNGLICSTTSFIAKTLMPPIAVLLILWASFLFLTAGANPSKITSAKQVLISTIIGIGIVLIAPSLVSLAINIAGNSSGSNAVDICSSGQASVTFTDAFIRLINWFSWLVAVLSVFVGFYAGFLYITAGGDPIKASTANKVIIYALVGIVVAIVSFSIISIVKGIVGV